jgi:orotidine-5'-phosphate decarboxylase
LSARSGSRKASFSTIDTNPGKRRRLGENMTSRERIIVALDFPTESRALEMVTALRGSGVLFKVGLQLYTAAGPHVVRSIRETGADVFLDLKLLDIPNTVAQAAVEGARLGVRMMTLHTLGGPQMMAAARRAVLEISREEGWRPPLLLGVTVLTSMTDSSLTSIGLGGPLDAAVLRLAGLARAAGMAGIVCSPRELNLLRSARLTGLIRVTPGIRSPLDPVDDQARTLTAAEAVRRGADYLVIGRPITRVADPAAAVQQILAEIDSDIIEEP